MHLHKFCKTILKACKEGSLELHDRSSCSPLRSFPSRISHDRHHITASGYSLRKTKPSARQTRARPGLCRTRRLAVLASAHRPLDGAVCSRVAGRLLSGQLSHREPPAKHHGGDRAADRARTRRGRAQWPVFTICHRRPHHQRCGADQSGLLTTLGRRARLPRPAPDRAIPPDRRRRAHDRYPRALDRLDSLVRAAPLRQHIPVSLRLRQSADREVGSPARHQGMERELNLARTLFWMLVLSLAWPFLHVRWRGRKEHNPATPPSIADDAEPPADFLTLFGVDTILRSLILFNALFAFQTALDLVFLWGNAKLPSGISYADYAHRGAYPLIVTALLSAGFVLAAMRSGGAAEQSKIIRPLVYLWLGQNVMLVISSMLRLSRYVEIYMLTGWRIAALVWMLLVAIGLVLIVARIILGQSGGWLVRMNLMSLTATLYVCAL